MANLGLSDIQITESGQTLTGTAQGDLIDISGTVNILELPDNFFVINAGAGDDQITGSSFHTTINAEAGNDTIYAGTTLGAETINGGEGSDTAALNFNPIFDLIDYENSNGEITLRTKGTSSTTLTNVEYFVFTSSPQSLSRSKLDATSLTTSGFTYKLTTEQFDTLINQIDLTDNANTPIDSLYLWTQSITNNGVVISTESSSNDFFIGSDVDFAKITAKENKLSITGIDLGIENDYTTYVIDNNAAELLSSATISYVWENGASSLLAEGLGSSAATTVTALTPSLNINGTAITPDNYVGPVQTLDFQYIGNDDSESAFGTIRDDFINLQGGDDAAGGGLGNDVLDGGSGSNFLTGGNGNDTFFLDGRSGETTWSTIADFDSDTVNIWGWNEGISRLLLTEESAGAEGFKGATFHFDLDNDGNIDTSITFTGLTYSSVPNSAAKVVEGNGYLLFSQTANAELLM